MYYETWIPAVLIAVASAALLLDFDFDGPLEPNDAEGDDKDIGQTDQVTDDIEDIDAPLSAPLAGYPLVAANMPEPPSSSEG